MQSQNKISFPYNKFFVIGLLFCSIVSFDVLGQEERGKAISDTPAEYDHITVVDGADHAALENKSVERMAAKKSFTQEPERNEQLYKQGGEKDSKKEGMSTLSFNLFLYVVDKFKEDN